MSGVRFISTSTSPPEAKPFVLGISAPALAEGKKRASVETGDSPFSYTAILG